MNKNDFGILVLSICVVVAFCGAPILIFLGNIEKANIGFETILQPSDQISQIEVYNLISGGDIHIKELSRESENLIEFEWDLSYTGLSSPENSISITHMIINSIFILYINTPLNLIIKELNMTIFFNPTYTYSIISNTENANVNFDALNVHFNKFTFKTSSGNLNIKLNSCTVEDDFLLSTSSGEIRLMLDYINFSKDFICQSNSGLQFYDIWNIRFNSIADFKLTSNSGYIRLYWANHFNKSQNVNIYVQSDYDVKVKFWCPLEIMRSQILLYTYEGTTNFDRVTGTFEEIGENFYQTCKINDRSLDSYNITAISNSGQAWVYHVNCFKWSRNCDYTQDFLPYNVNNYGNYSLYRQDYDVSGISLYNQKYIYLNESRSLMINFEPLEVSSNLIFYIKWDFTYIHAMGIGVGDVNMKINQYNVSGTLLIYISLDFILDKILPTFVKCNITAYYHPNYNFIQE